MFLFYITIFLIIHQNFGIRSQLVQAGAIFIAHKNMKSILDERVIVDIAQGTLRGQLFTTDDGVSYYGFKGIPYAKPPVGELRFKEPQPPLSWEGVRDATVEGNMCVQGDLVSFTKVSGDEDCLFLNVYTTELPTDTVSPNLSVMVWIHGGAYAVGSGGTFWYGPDFLINNKDIVLVTVNYRLGVLGFFGLNHTGVSKNNGLRDQLAALQWVRENIDKFGGSPEDVTIFGESAGGSSVHYQLLSPLSKGLFHKAISQSGSALDNWAYTDPQSAHENALSLGRLLSYNASDESELLMSLLLTDAYELTLAASQLQGSSFIFIPTHEHGEGSFLPDVPLNIMKSGNFNQVPYITGSNSDEGKVAIVDVLSDSSLWSVYEENFEALYVPKELGLKQGSPESLKVAEEIKKTYFGNESLSENVLPEFIDLQTDIRFLVGIHRTVNIQRQTGNSPIYFYQFGYLGNLSMSIFLYNITLPGAAHGDDIGYVFKMYDYNITVSEDSTEAQTVKRITKLWTNFAKTGMPSLEENVSWEPLTDDNNTYLNINIELTIKDYDSLNVERMAFWDELYKEVDAL